MNGHLTKSPTEPRTRRRRASAVAPHARVASVTIFAHPALPADGDAARGFSGVMSRVCEMVWPVWPDTASSEHGADLAVGDRSMLGIGACGTAVSRHAMLERTPMAPVDRRRADCAPI
ncbi:hypothetical protein [Pararobbsia silviterrae]|uniref:Uncharacterized protein n=1 Tax=Pararobbsia silviterrae TaxID=1792498 RepID=A0A494Y972_9BURK|nr:hypothetical protein [Pararobbsia silviterrae]RKP59194.1 hypothetical protein D7S86_04675 [Pararobbsia silviterrae]